MTSAIDSGSVWDDVLELTKTTQEKNSEPSIWGIQLSSKLNSAGLTLPSTELAHLLVDYICWDNHVPITWKLLEKAIALEIVPPLLVLALLSIKVIPNRKCHPTGYRLYMELLRRHAFSLSSLVSGPNLQKIMQSIDDVLGLSKIFGHQVCEPGLLAVEFVFATTWQLLDASLDDEGLLELTPEKKSRWPTELNAMEIDGHNSFPLQRTEQHEGMLKENTGMAVEIIGEFFQGKGTSEVLLLVRHNMPSHWAGLVQRLKLLAANSAIFRNSKHVNPDTLLRFTSETHDILSGKCKMTSQEEFLKVTASRSLISTAGVCHGTSQSALWLPIDLFLEDAMNGAEVAPISAVENLTCLVKALQAVNGTSWHEAFLGLWVAALRLIQRERDPGEGPIPRLDTALCMLLSITTLAVAEVIEEEESGLIIEPAHGLTDQWKEKESMGKCREGLITSLLQLGEYKSLLTPPKPINVAANQAAAKAIMFNSGLTVGKGSYECMSVDDLQLNCAGNMRHLIVEACIARKLLDTSAYMWPGYVNAQSNQVPRNLPGQMHGWSLFMKGSPLTPSMINMMILTPASSLAEIEKVYEIALNGSDDEKIAAASILCGASLIRGWSIQEHTILFIVRLLSPPSPADYSGSQSHLIEHAAFLNVLLVGISPVDCVQCFALHGLVPLLAGALLPICEAFGSCVPSASWTLPTGEKVTCHTVFSNAFTLLLRLWRFDQPPLEYVMGDVAPVGSFLCPEYLLLVRNARLASFGNLPKDHMKKMRLSRILNFSAEPIFMDSFPKLKRWYRQHQECLASTLSGLVHGTPVHEIVDALLQMMFRKINKGDQSSASTASASSDSLSPEIEDAYNKLKIPAWNILEATPFVLDAALTACGHGKLSPRELTTGLKDLADFLPATLVAITGYFAAEVSRGIWKPASMNGTDWPSPGANLAMVEQQIKNILAATGVDVPSLAIGGSSPATLPLPLAALVSFTITYKLDSRSECFLALIGPSLNSLATSCPWPCMPILASLWAQKAKRWSNFFVFSASRTVFHHNRDALVQLLKSCFTSALGLGPPDTFSKGSIGSLLGHGLGPHIVGKISPVAPGFHYLRVFRSVRSIIFMSEEILSLVMHSVRDIGITGLSKSENLKKTKYALKYGQVSLAAAMTRVRLAASLGASLLWISGGSNLVQSLIKETLPSWFLAVRTVRQDDGESGGMVSMLVGYALAYLAVLCGTFVWGVDLKATESKRCPKVLGIHFEFLASALNGKITLGCDWAVWRAYISSFIGLIVECTPKWLLEVDADVLKRLSEGLRRANEEELALALLRGGRVRTMGAAAELIIRSGLYKDFTTHLL